MTRTAKIPARDLLPADPMSTDYRIIRDTGTPHTCPPRTIALDPNCARCQELKRIGL